ncbi:Lipoprotein OS=Streptomyces antimycoticus OX=68175 GN=SANT12839_048020 PE=4 SV=1 [Streptomyces antimycoticus]
MRYTNQIDYGDDPRDNATINSIGSDTGYCPPVQHQ